MLYNYQNHRFAYSDCPEQFNVLKKYDLYGFDNEENKEKPEINNIDGQKETVGTLNYKDKFNPNNFL